MSLADRWFNWEIDWPIQKNIKSLLCWAFYYLEVWQTKGHIAGCFFHFDMFIEDRRFLSLPIRHRQSVPLGRELLRESSSVQYVLPNRTGRSFFPTLQLGASDSLKLRTAPSDRRWFGEYVHRASLSVWAETHHVIKIPYLVRRSAWIRSHFLSAKWKLKSFQWNLLRWARMLESMMRKSAEYSWFSQSEEKDTKVLLKSNNQRIFQRWWWVRWAKISVENDNVRVASERKRSVIIKALYLTSLLVFSLIISAHPLFIRQRECNPIRVLVTVVVEYLTDRRRGTIQ